MLIVLILCVLASKATREFEHQNTAGDFAPLVVDQFGESIRTDFFLHLRGYHIRDNDKWLYRFGYSIQSHLLDFFR